MYIYIHVYEIKEIINVYLSTNTVNCGTCEWSTVCRNMCVQMGAFYVICNKRGIHVHKKQREGKQRYIYMYKYMRICSVS